VIFSLFYWRCYVYISKLIFCQTQELFQPRVSKSLALSEYFTVDITITIITIIIIIITIIIIVIIIIINNYNLQSIQGGLRVLTFARWVSRSVRALMYSRILSLKAALTTFHWFVISVAVLHNIWSIRSRYCFACARTFCDLVMMSLLCWVQLSWLETLQITRRHQYIYVRSAPNSKQ